MDSPRRILVVEDDPATQELLTRHLASLGCLVDLAADGETALSLWGRNAYDLVLTDLNMPGMSGSELIASIRAAEGPQAPQVPIIAMTGYLAAGVAPPDPTGVGAFLGKPFSVLDLTDLLERWAPSKAGRDAGDAALRPSAGHQHAVRTSGTDPPGDEEILLAIAGTFIATIPTYLEELGTACAGRNRTAIEDAAHKLKSAARVVGGTEVAELCEAIERAGPAVRLDELLGLAGRIPDALTALEQRLASAVPAKEADST